MGYLILNTVIKKHNQCLNVKFIHSEVIGIEIYKDTTGFILIIDAENTVLNVAINYCPVYGESLERPDSHIYAIDEVKLWKDMYLQSQKAIKLLRFIISKYDEAISKYEGISDE